MAAHVTLARRLQIVAVAVQVMTLLVMLGCSTVPPRSAADTHRAAPIGNTQTLPGTSWGVYWKTEKERSISLAQQGDAEAQYLVAIYSLGGIGGSQDPAKGAEWLRKSAEQGYEQAQTVLGTFYFHGRNASPALFRKDYREAARWYLMAAKQGGTTAQNQLGKMYSGGKGVPQDYGEAAKWWGLAAGQNNASAQNSLGMLYLTGHGVPQDDRKAAEWFQKAASKGFAEAQFRLGVMYATGYGVPKDYVKADMWLNLAVASLPPGGTRNAAVKNREDNGALMTPGQIAEAQRMARERRERYKSGGLQ